jgi:3-dehydroquinate synthase
MTQIIQAPSPEMQIITVELEQNSYPVYLGNDILSDQSIWQNHVGNGAVLVVSNDTVAPLYLSSLLAALPQNEIATHIIPDGERWKTTDTWCGVIDQLIGMQAKRDATVIALGGGVVGDIAGFASASYMRGIRFIQVPTTLLAQVDASVGGKTGINHLQGKNLIGAFHQPASVMIDTATLSTLPQSEFNAGMAEVLKYGVIMDPGFLRWLESSAEAIQARDVNALQYLTKQCVINKAKIVSADEKEGGIRAILNFGHTFGHALETLTGYDQYLHGEAVAIGMIIASRLSEIRGLCPAGVTDRIRGLVNMFGLPSALPSNIASESMIDAMELDKKALASGLRLILLNSIGSAVIDDQSKIEQIEAALNSSRTPRAIEKNGE